MSTGEELHILTLYPRQRATDIPRQESAWASGFYWTVLKRALSTLAENHISFQWSAADSLFTICSELPSSHMNTVTTGLYCSANW